MASPELYKVRSLLGHTESCLYVCLQLRDREKDSWFTLCRKPDQTLTNDSKSSGYVLARVPIPDSPRAHSLGLVAVGSDIYNIGGSGSTEAGRTRSSSVSVLDCRCHTWREGPSLRLELWWLSASVLDRKIYVAGNYGDRPFDSPKNSVEVFDTETQTWDPEPIPCSEINDYNFIYCRSIWVDGNFHVAAFAGKALAYISKEDRWDTVEPWMQNYLCSPSSYCKIENVVYSASPRALLWYDTEVSMWRDLKGLVGLPKLYGASFVRLADYGGKLALLWDDGWPYHYRPFFGYDKMIWCAEISLERHESSEIWGKLEWFDHVLPVPVHYSFVNALAATV